ncbi:MAG: beta-galactosidase, partial [Balneolaceae bacterium]|nr:beta-galactosidase [Balneolaceae bacterium]
KWLQDEHGTIRRLNTVWKTDYSGFDAIPLPKEKPRSECSPGEWYDRIRFHNHRVTSFFGFFSDQIRSYLPEVKIHLKAQDNSSLGPMRQAVGHGIDREALTRHIDLQGLDTRPLPVTEPRMAASSYDGSHYGFHWLGQSFLYDYLTSLPPGRPIVDFEYHAFSINPIRIPDLPRNHASATLWLAHMHGMVGNMAWYWHRRYGPDPFLDTWYWKLWLYASLSTQPVPAAEYFQTMLELNTFSREVEALATVPDGPVCIMVSKPSYIQDPSHIDALHRVYEGSSFHGLRVGFVTDQMLVRGGVPSDCRVMFVPNMAYLGKAALNVLEGVKEKLILYGGKKPRFDPYGFPHAPETVRFLENVAGIEEASAPVLSRRIGRLLTSYTGTLPIRIKRLDRSDGFGVMNRQAGVDDRQVMLLVNVLTNPTEVQMISKRGEPISGYDLLNDEPVDGKKISMPFQGVRLIQIDQE